MTTFLHFFVSGLVNEVLTGIMQRSDWQQAVNAIKIGHIPAGRGNGLASSLGAFSGRQKFEQSMLACCQD